MNRAVSLRPDINGRSDGTGFRRWVVAFCCIRFDLEQGQVVEECFPAGALSPEEELDVAFSSFPDSMSQADNRASIHDCFFFFRIRRRGVVVSPFSQSTIRRTTSLLNYERHGGVSPGGSPAKDGSEFCYRSREGSPASEHGQLLATEADPFQVNSPGDRRLSGGASADEVQTPPRTDVESAQGGEGVWGNVPVPSLIASVLSPRLRPRNESPGEGQGSKVGNGSPQPSHPSVKDRGNGGLDNHGNFHVISGSGAPKYLYGFVFNRQRQDERLKRGGEQKSLVVLSERPFLCVFKPLVQILGPLYFDVGSKALEQVASEVSLWPAPLHGQQMELPVANSTIRTHLPPAHTLPPGSGNPLDEFTCAIAPAAPVTRSVPLGIFHQADLFGMFRGVLMQLWVLWELLLVGEPLLVVAPTPSQCCEAVAALVGLVAPLPCSVDFRPYFTIHDPDFASLNALKEGEPVPPMVLGVTNPFFLKALRNFSNVISVGSVQPTANRYKSARASAQNGIKLSEGRLQHQLQLQLSPLKRFSPTNLLKVARVKKDGPSSLMSEHKEALWTNFVSCTKPDTNVLNRLVDAEVTTPRTEESVTLVNNDILQRHFTELTTNFLSPFGPYLRASAPQEGASPFADPPPLPSFNVQEFLEGLAARGSGKFLAKRLRGNWLELYRRFLKGPNFMPWFQRRRSVAEQEQHRIWRQARSKADVRGFLAKMSEVEVIDAFSAIERHLINELQIVQRAGLGNSEGPICQKLRSDLRAIFNVLPKDMQQMLLFNPTRASLLQGGRELTKHPGRASFSFRNSDDLTRKTESFRIRNSSSPELTGRKSMESPAVTSRISPLASKRVVSRAEELAQDPLHL